jgi:hypothetical protein
MEAVFHQLRVEDPEGRSLPADPVHALDESASTTETNLTGFFKSDVYIESGGKIIVLVTSTGHLIKVAKALEKLLGKAELKTVQRVLLVGAESFVSLGSVPSPYRYLKSMLHDIFSDLHEREQEQRADFSKLSRG